MSTESNSGGQVMQVKNWHVVLTLLLWLIGGAMAFATLRAQADETERRVLELEKRPTVTYDQYQDGQQAIKERLTRIENKLDAEQRRQR
jgi:hypothetical protein